MAKLEFRSNSRPTLGVELELALVDAHSMALTSAAPKIFDRLPSKFEGSIKPELMKCYLELNTEVCENVDEVGDDLREKLTFAEEVAESVGARLYWSGSHPFSVWQDQEATPQPRYLKLLESLQDMGRQLVTFGLHVHVGVESGDKAVMICERMLRRLPLLLAASCNSPWWNSRVTGLLSHRSKIMEGLPTSGLPPLMRNWSEYVWLVTHLEETGFIHSIRDIWWVVRPHHNFGTVEVRVCDMPGQLEDALAFAAVIQGLVCLLDAEIDEGVYQHDCHPMLVRQNMWRAERYGLNAEFVDTFTHRSLPVREAWLELLEQLQPVIARCRSARHAAQFKELISGPTWAERQLAALEETGDPAAVVRRMLERSAAVRAA